MTPDFGYLCDHPDAAAPLARWHWEEWAAIIPGWTEAEALAELRTHTGRRQLPTTIVAYMGAELAGSASLLAEDLPDFPPLVPWVASIYVRPEWRGQGLGEALTPAGAGRGGGARLSPGLPVHHRAGRLVRPDGLAHRTGHRVGWRGGRDHGYRHRPTRC